MNDLERVYRKSKDKYLKTLSRVLKSYTEAEDVFHSAVERSVKYFPTYNPELSPIDVWFSRIVYNELSRHLRKTKKDLFVEYKEDEMEQAPDFFIEIVKQSKEYKDQGDAYNVINLYFIKGYEIKDICKATGFSERFVRTVNSLFKYDLRG